MWLPVKWRHFRSREVTWQTPASCSPARAQSTQNSTYMPLQPLPGDFRSNDVTSGSLPVTWGHVTSFHVTWLPPPASYSPVKAQTCPKHDTLSVIEVTTGKSCHFRSHEVRDVISCHVRATPASYSPVGAQTYPKLDLYTFYSHFQVTCGQMTSLPGHFRSREVTWRHFLSRDGHLLQVTALNELKLTQNSTYSLS